LRNRDRKYLAIEMESAGVLCAAYTREIHTFIVRGISDTGNEMKAELDKIDKGAIRRYAMINATMFLWTLLDLNLLERSTSDRNQHNQ
jgi:nucleoside phosphorylase